MPEDKPAEALLSDGLLTVRLPEGWVVRPSVTWHLPDLSDEDGQQVAHPDGQDAWQLSANLGRVRHISPEGVAYDLTVFFQGSLPQPPTIAVMTGQRPFTTGGLSGIRFSATLEPDMGPFWREPGYVVDVLTIDAGTRAARPSSPSHDSRWLATIHRVGDSRGEAATNAIWNSLVIEP
nr:hypothetical protein [Propionicimonas sp.]